MYVIKMFRPLWFDFVELGSEIEINPVRRADLFSNTIHTRNECKLNNFHAMTAFSSRKECNNSFTFEPK